MLFSKKYKIVVSNPCDENWDKMLPMEKGRFCNSCAKKVVDYTGMSDKQMNEVLRNASESTCGRFTKKQIEKNYTVKPQLQLSSQRRFFQYILTFLLGSKAFVNKAIGQDTLKTEQTDSLKLIVQADSCITDTVAIAQADTLSWKPDSTWLVYEPEVIKIIFVTETISGVWAPQSVQTDDWLRGIVFIPAIFDTIKHLVKREPGDEKEIRVEKEITFIENKVPEKRKSPVKKEEPISAILPEELKRKSEENLEA